MSSGADHDYAMRLCDLGDMARRESRWQIAATYYLQSADYEQKALAAIPREKVRTRMIVARSLSRILWRHREVLREMASEATQRPVQGS